jgi:hypothetical protein
VLWHALGFPAWVLTMLPNVQATHSQAAFLGQATGMLIVPVVARIVYVMALAGPPRVWERALFSPWVWAIGLALNLMAASGHHPH